MIEIHQALIETVGILEESSIDYMVIGGLANLIWREYRTTLDIDITIWAEDDQIPSLLEKLRTKLKITVARPEDHIERTRVLPLEAPNGITVELMFGLLPFEREALDRAVPRSIAGKKIRFITAEDLILHKIISDREKDLGDVDGIVRHCSTGLDLGYLEPRIREHHGKSRHLAAVGKVKNRFWSPRVFRRPLNHSTDENTS